MVYERLQDHVQKLYPDSFKKTSQSLFNLLETLEIRPKPHNALFSEKDVALITYGDQVQHANQPPLESLDTFLRTHDLNEAFSILHVLPFFPSTSDDGFSVVDYRKVDPTLGNWDHIEKLRSRFDLMIDFVINHTSSQNDWFQRYLKGDPSYQEYFISCDPSTNLSQVVRPRTHDLLCQWNHIEKPKHIWSTFSRDQVDLNFRSPKVFLEMIAIYIDYLRRGARILRVDAIAYLFKELGTPCIHLEPTHEFVRLMRTIADHWAPRTLLLTETNVPHDENLSYLGQGDEAHMVYQFGLPPLMLHAILSENTTHLQHWLQSLPRLQENQSFFNFTACHDGIGVRPLEGLLPNGEIGRLALELEQKGCLVNYKRNSDGSQTPYELNSTYFSALSKGDDLDAARFLASQTILISLKGIPAIYFHSLFGFLNDLKGVNQTGIKRRINREKFTKTQLETILRDEKHVSSTLFRKMKHLMAIRNTITAFSPLAEQEILQIDRKDALAIRRTNHHTNESILVWANLSSRPIQIPLKQKKKDLITQNHHENYLILEPFQVVWLKGKEA